VVGKDWLIKQRNKLDYMSYSKRFFSLFLYFVIYITAGIFLSGCDEKKRQLSIDQTERVTQMESLLTAVQLYQEDNGKLPLALVEIVTNGIRLTNYPLSKFKYNPKGAIEAEGAIWIISATNPANPKELILGRLPHQVKILSLQTNSP
jgi:hypothetical protein